MTKIVRTLGLSLALVAVAGLTGPPFAAGQAKKDKDTKAATAVFQVHKGNDGKFYFSMRDGDGILLALSGKGYESKVDCNKVIETIRASAAKAKIEDMDTADKKTEDKKTEDKKKKK